MQNDIENSSIQSIERELHRIAGLSHEEIKLLAHVVAADVKKRKALNVITTSIKEVG